MCELVGNSDKFVKKKTGKFQKKSLYRMIKDGRNGTE